MRRDRFQAAYAIMRKPSGRPVFTLHQRSALTRTSLFSHNITIINFRVRGHLTSEIITPKLARDLRPSKTSVDVLQPSGTMWHKTKGKAKSSHAFRKAKLHFFVVVQCFLFFPPFECSELQNSNQANAQETVSPPFTRNSGWKSGHPRDS